MAMHRWLGGLGPDPHVVSDVPEHDNPCYKQENKTPIIQRSGHTRGNILAAPEAPKRTAGNGGRQVLVWIGVSIAAATLCWLMRGVQAIEHGIDT
jgi:hypothetical protein